MEAATAIMSVLENFIVVVRLKSDKGGWILGWLMGYHSRPMAVYLYDLELSLQER